MNQRVNLKKSNITNMHLLLLEHNAKNIHTITKKLKSNMNTETEKSQEQIRFENTCLRLCVGSYSHYQFKSIGNIAYWLQALGLVQYDVVTIGWENDLGEVHLHSERIATFIFDEIKRMPIFTFIEKYDRLTETQEIYIAGLDKFENPYEKL